jgi:ribosomal subunit interface protein
VKRFIELKHVKAKEQVRALLGDLMDRVDHKLRHFQGDAVSLHVMFEETNGRRALFRASVSCHMPGHTVAAHEERHEAGLAIREAFAEVERQLEKRKATRRHERQVRRSKRRRAELRMRGEETA